jgi:hypothetical protein
MQLSGRRSMTFTQEDRRDKIRSQLKYEITHPSLWYEPAKKKADKPNIDFVKKGEVCEKTREQAIKDPGRI